MAQLLLPLLASATDVVVSSPRPLRRRRRLPSVHQQLVFAFPYQPPPQTPRKTRRQRPEHPHAAVHRLALAHVDLADKIAGNFARRTTHSFDDLRQLAVIGLLKAAARFDGTGGRSFRPYARTYANGEITHYLRDHGFAIKVPPSWRDLYASGQKLLREGQPPHAVPQRLGITAERWREIHDACSVTVIALQADS
ncbi:sigma factor [Cyanobium sp. ATX 6F1]|uniref:sigma factor n=1 Tax=unclassified Cyanobium TaxID=2627006 RepID=UPI0020CB7303|nr:sigma factor [Cyanobium sp. ATX 6F1]MCP9915337.1 RNA polymerase subunit sigma-70 [Cyanobium sp. ATX 6F1]